MENTLPNAFTSGLGSKVIRLAPAITVLLCASAFTSTMSAQFVTNSSGTSLPTGNFGIGTSTPSALFEVDSQSQAQRGIVDGQYSDDNFAAALTFMKARGSMAQPTAVAAGDNLATMVSWGYDGTTMNRTSRVRFFVDGTVGVGVVPTALQFTTGVSTLGETERMRITSAGNVGIGTANPQYLLTVNGTLGATNVVTNPNGWSDYVFEPGYHLTPLDEVAAYVSEHHHLPEIPSAAEVAEKGISVGDMESKLLAKIEELTLHMIQAEQKGRVLEQTVQTLRDQVTRQN